MQGVQWGKGNMGSHMEGLWVNRKRRKLMAGGDGDDTREGGRGREMTEKSGGIDGGKVINE